MQIQSSKFKVQSVIHLLLASALAFGFPVFSHAQGTFRNLDFESANIPPGTQPGTFISITAALPGWGGTAPVAYDGLSGGGAVISVVDTNIGGNINPLQGRYSVFLFGGVGGSATISQTGLIPIGTESLQMDLAGPGVSLLIVSVGGQTIQLTPVATLANYTQYAGDISSFAGQTKTMSFAEPPPVGVPPSILELDNIQFSVNPIPEPGTCALLFCGAVAFGVNRWRKQNANSKLKI